MRRYLPAVATMLGVAALSGCAVETYDVSYSSVFEARAHEADTRGWIPEWLPEGSTEILQRHQGRESDAILLATLPPDADLDPFCTPGATPPEIPLNADWFELTSAPSTALACDDRWYALVEGSELLMWRSGDL